jgi:N-acetylglucosaminyl-diphospho-decaprenol L-rhamnosyltransferase
VADRTVDALRVDVGVVTWNSAEVTPDALRRTLDADTDGLIASLLVHDNASTDGTPERISDEVPEAEVEVSAGNLGFAAGVNRIIERSSAPWLLLLNPDAWLEPQALARLVDAAERSESIAGVAPRIESPDGALEESTHPFPSLRVAALSALGLRRVVQWPHDEARQVDWAIGAALLLRRRAIEDIGGFDERYFMYAEDLDWCWRARQRGWAIHLEPSAVVRHIGNVSGDKRFGASRDAIAIGNAIRFYRASHGRAAAAAWRTLNAVGTARLGVVARIRRDPAGAAYWMRHARAYARSGSIRDEV